MAEQVPQAGERLSVGEYTKLLKVLKIKLPKGVLTAAAIARSAQTDVVQDARRIRRALESCRLLVAPIPRLACGKIKHALQLKEKHQCRDVTEMIFFRDAEDSENETLMMRWENNAQPDCGFRIRESYKEASVEQLGGAQHSWFHLNHSENQRNTMECYQFYLEQRGLTEEEVTCKKNGKLEFGFLSGKLDFLVDIKRSRITEKIIIKCNSVSKTTPGEILTLPEDGFQAEFNSSHQHYLQAQAYLFMLKEKQKTETNQVPVSAVRVVKVKASRRSKPFYWGAVSDDTQEMERLNNFCEDEALPRFLAVLHLVFERE